MKVKFVIAYKDWDDDFIPEGTIGHTACARHNAVDVNIGGDLNISMSIPAFNTCCREITDAEELLWIKRDEYLHPNERMLCVN